MVATPLAPISRSSTAGFSLIELVVSVGIVAVLLSITLIAINPADQFLKANNAKRIGDLSGLYKAMEQYQTANKGSLPPGIPVNTQYGPATIARVGGLGYDLCSLLVPQYLPGLPQDPVSNAGRTIDNCGPDYNTGYAILSDAAGRFAFYAEGVSPRIVAGTDIDLPYLHYTMDTGPGGMVSTGIVTTNISAGASGVNSATGRYGNALDFDGTSSVILIDQSAFSVRDLSSYTIEAWVRLSSTTGLQTIYAERTATGLTQKYRVYLAIDNGQIVFGGSTNSDPTADPVAWVNGPSISAGTWYHIAAVFDDQGATGDVQKLYVNGTASTVSTATDPMPNTIYAGNLSSIGASPWGTDQLNGALDDLRIYRYARSDLEIENDINNVQ